MKKVISVIGGDGDVPAEVLRIAEGIGSDIAKNDCVLVCGGRGGVMEAACRGAKKEGGLTVGILPSLDRSEANPHVDVPLTTSLGKARNAVVVSTADAVIAIQGSIGTFSEIGLALNYGKPVVVVEGSSGVADKLKDFTIEKDGRPVRVHSAPAEKAIEKALSLIQL